MAREVTDQRAAAAPTDRWIAKSTIRASRRLTRRGARSIHERHEQARGCCRDWQAPAAAAAGCLLKDATRAELADAVHDAARGKTVLAPTVADRLVHFVRQPNSVTLSAREVEVLAQVAKGKTNAEIGHQLHISEATVKTHLLRAFNKLGVSDRTAAVTTAMSLGLLGG
jgi:ATP/maltotriose-dependent transcriptional regulator MalT